MFASETDPKAPHIRLHGETYGRIRFTPEPPDECCFDCGAEPGHVHELGCDAETCPRCAGQLISCGCWENANLPDMDEEHIRRTIHDDIHRRRTQEAVNRASDAFRLRDYAAVIELLTPFEAELSPATLRKLRFAWKQLGRAK